MRKIQGSIKSLADKGFFHILLGGTLTKVIAFFSSILIVRFVTKEDYAFLSYSDNIFSYLYLVVALGFDAAVLKFCVGDDRKYNNAYFSFAVRVSTCFCVCVVIAVELITHVFPIAFLGARPYITAMMVYPVLYLWSVLSQNYMRARLKNREFAYAGIIQVTVVFVLSLSMVHFVGAYSLVIARYVAITLVIVYVIRQISGDLGGEKAELNKEQKLEFSKFGFSLLIANVFSMIMPINETFLVNNLIQDTTISANYKVANLIPQQLPFITSAIVTFYFPYFAMMKDRAEIWRRAKKIGAMTACIIAGTAFIGIVISPFIIKLAYGSKYDDINYLMSVLWIMHALNAGLRMLPMNILPAIGYTRFNVWMSVFSCVFHFVIDYFCIKAYGVNGAVVAGCLVYFFTAVLYWAYLRKKLTEDENGFLSESS